MIDNDLIMKDAGLVASSAAATVDSSAQVADVGEGIVKGELVVDVTAIEIADNDELFKISLQGSSKSDFADTYEDLAILELGAAEVLGGDQDSTTGRYVVPFRTERNGTVYDQLRVYTTVSGTVGTGINYTAYLRPQTRQ
jgi:hypothetical protein